MRCWEQVFPLVLLVVAVVAADEDAEDTRPTAMASFLKQLRNCSSPLDVFSCAEKALDKLAGDQEVAVTPGVAILRVDGPQQQEGRSLGGHEGEGLGDALGRYLRTHVLRISLPQLVGQGTKEAARSFLGLFSSSDTAATDSATGKSSFLAGFGLGFLAFAIKKLLLPVLIGAQIAKSVLIAMFLPSLLGGLGKLLGKGVSTFASASGASGSSGGGGVDDFEFKDNLDTAETGVFAYPETPGVLPAAALYPGNSAKYPVTAAPKVSYGYGQRPAGSSSSSATDKRHDFKVFHQIPKSSLLLSHYDPFYSPLLSRLDSVFKQLGSDTEACREQLVCAMYSNPAKFAPYSNLVSAQLSRELNELRKPATDNPEILRFFRYMKAAKDGQDGRACAQLHPGCVVPGGRPPMVQTFQDINKLVQARRLGRLFSTTTVVDHSQVSKPDVQTRGASEEEGHAKVNVTDNLPDTTIDQTPKNQEVKHNSTPVVKDHHNIQVNEDHHVSAKRSPVMTESQHKVPELKVAEKTVA